MRLRPPQSKDQEVWEPSPKVSFNTLAYVLTTDLIREAKAGGFSLVMGNKKYTLSNEKARCQLWL